MLSASKTAAPSTGGYTISRSVRLRSSASAYLNRTPGSATNQQKWTWSAWVKIGDISSSDTLVLFSSGDGTTNNYCRIEILTNQIQFSNVISGSSAGSVQTTSVYRDPSAWYHIVVAVDTTQSTAANRAILYVNGVSVAWTFSTNVTQNSNTWINSANAHYLFGRQSYAASSYFDGYATEINFIDGQALTPTSFGAYNSTTGVWQPIKYSGTYGTNGFYLNFNNNASTTTLGYDTSGNGNNWTTNNISLTSGSTYDSMTDVPTLTSSTAANYAVLNPIFPAAGTPTLNNGNLTYFNSTSTNNWYTAPSTMVAKSSFYAEFSPSAVATYWTLAFGLTPTIDATGATLPGLISSGGGFSIYQAYNSSGNSYSAYNGSSVGTYAGSNWSTSTVLMLAYDATTGRVYAGRDGTWFNSGNPSAGTGYISTLSTTADLFVHVSLGNSSGMNANFGQRPFTYTPPTGFVALNTYNLPTPTIKNGASYMAATTYTGTGSALSINNGNNTTTGVSFKPDLVWIKQRSSPTENHNWFDSVRGSPSNYSYLQSNTTGAEAAPGITMLSALNSNGFTLGTNGGVNTSTYTYAAWQWQAGAGSSSSNTNGSITSTVSVNTTAGFSVVTYTGNGSTGTVGHGLGVAPNMIITKERNASGNSWPVWLSGVTSATQYLYLNSTNAIGTSANFWNSTVPTSSVFSVGNDSATNGTGTHVAYCFAAIKGFSAFGSYTGNGSTDGPFVYCGFRPRWIMIKRTDSTSDWNLMDTSRDTYNQAQNGLFANLSSAETTGYYKDFLSNGFKIRDNGASTNASGGTYIFAAFAEAPFNYSLAR